jgi:hypothetical protein
VIEINREKVCGADVLNEVSAEIRKYCILPGEHAYVAVTLWCAATHAQLSWEHATRLVIKSPLKRCGKTRLLEVLLELAYAALPAANISVAALVHGIDENDPPTLFLDEADAIFAKRRGDHSETAEALRGILNTGFGRRFPYVRYDVSTRANISSSTYCMAAIAAIGDLPDTIEDRAVSLTMQRRAAGERVAPWRSRKVVPRLRDLREKIHNWIVVHANDLAEAEPESPVDDREADAWEPLLAVADLAGGDWPDRARAACLFFSGETTTETESTGERLLEDVHGIFQRYPEADRLGAKELREALVTDEEAPWCTYSHDRPLSLRDLALLLKPYNIRSEQMRLGADNRKGYYRSSFSAAWSRYRRTPETSETNETERATPPDFVSGNDVSDDVSDDARLSETYGFESKDGHFEAAVSDVSDVSGKHVAPSSSRWCSADGCIQIVRPDRDCPQHGTTYEGVA